MDNHEIYSIIDNSPVPALESGPEAIAEQLVMLIHRGVDWSVWGGDRRYRYWDALADRVRAATYAGSGLQDWWEAMEKQIRSQPKNPEDRQLVTILLMQTKEDQRLILAALRKHAGTLVMRTRVHIDAAKNRKTL
jgi:hypothetical protein